ncbi:MAG: hypothetical protein IJ766_08195 [Clostridia bacterium]|nr:hypothetical protein [Clostridia bacterium]
MAHYIGKKRRKYKREYLNRMSRIPFNSEAVEPYTIKPSPLSLETDLLNMLYKIFTASPDSVDGQNGNMFDAYIDRWKALAQSDLSVQQVDHENKIADLVKVRYAIRANAVDWVQRDEETLQDINSKLAETLQEYKNFKI